MRRVMASLVALLTSSPSSSLAFVLGGPRSSGKTTARRVFCRLATRVSPPTQLGGRPVTIPRPAHPRTILRRLSHRHRHHARLVVAAGRAGDEENIAEARRRKRDRVLLKEEDTDDDDDALSTTTTTAEESATTRSGFGSALAAVELAVNASDVGVAVDRRGVAPTYRVVGPPEPSATRRALDVKHAEKEIVQPHHPVVELLRGSAPYIDLHRGSVAVVHVSSDVEDAFQDVMDDVATLHVLGVKVVLVTSVRRRVAAKVSGTKQRFVGRLRATGPEELQAVQAECGVARQAGVLK